MQYLGIDWGTRRAAWCSISQSGELTEGTISADEDGLVRLVSALGPEVRGCIEMMSGAPWVRDSLAACGWEIEIADARKVKAIAPLACKTDRVDARVLADLARRNLVPDQAPPRQGQPRQGRRRPQDAHRQLAHPAPRPALQARRATRGRSCPGKLLHSSGRLRPTNDLRSRDSCHPTTCAVERRKRSQHPLPAAFEEVAARSQRPLDTPTSFKEMSGSSAAPTSQPRASRGPQLTRTELSGTAVAETTRHRQGDQGGGGAAPSGLSRRPSHRRVGCRTPTPLPGT
jgi:hypothetical protein